MADSFERVLSSYLHLGSQVYSAASSIESEDIHSFLRWFLLDLPVVPVLLIFHTLNASLKIHSLLPPHVFWLKSLVVTTFAAFGGSTLAAVFSGRPSPLFTNSSNVMLSYILLAWYLVHKNALLRRILLLRPIAAVLAFGASAARMRAMFSFMDDYTREYPRVVAGAIVCGALSGSGGQLFVSFERMFHDDGGVGVLSDFSSPGWGFKSAYVASALYYVFLDPDDMLFDLGFPQVLELDRASARFYISAAMSIHAAVETLYGSHINPLFWLDSIFYAVTGLTRNPVPQSGYPLGHGAPNGDAAPSPHQPTGESGRKPHVMDQGLRKRR